METPAGSLETRIEKAPKLKSVETTAAVVTYLVSRLAVMRMLSLFELAGTIGLAFLPGRSPGKLSYRGDAA